MQTVARVVLTDTRGDLVNQIDQRSQVERAYPPPLPIRAGRTIGRVFRPHRRAAPRSDLLQRSGRLHPRRTRVRHHHRARRTTPAPWVNVMANPQFGTVISESGAAYTWAENAHEFRLTPWHNDPVSDTSGEAFYIRDEETGQFWSPTPLPARGARDAYVCRHGFGYSVFEYARGRHRLANCGPTWRWTRRSNSWCSRCATARAGPAGCRSPATGNWCSATGGAKSAMHVVTELDPGTGALFARNTYNTEFAERVAFLDASDTTADRHRRPHRVSRPQRHACQSRRHAPHATVRPDRRGPRPLRRDAGALRPGRRPGARDRLPARAPGEASTTRGTGPALPRPGPRAAPWRRLAILEPHAGRGACRDARPGARTCWPTAGCCTRRWPAGCGRAADSTSPAARSVSATNCRTRWRWCTPSPRLLREHCCGAPPASFARATCSTGGIRPRAAACARTAPTITSGCRYATCRYVNGTGDTGVLDERVPFLDGRPVNAEEESYYDLPRRSGEDGTLYEHCVRAIQHGLRFGEHGLPLMGCGDWNDGMNLRRRARQGRERVAGVLPLRRAERFAELARRRGDAELRRPLHERGGAAAARTSKRMAGTASGTGAPTSTTARRWARPQRRMPDRLHRAELGGAFRRRRSRARRAWPWMRWITPGPPRPRADPAPRSAVRQIRARTRLHQGLRARRARERRPVHPRRDLGGHGLRGPG